MNEAPKINVHFPVVGKQLPADHGYLLYAAISQIKPELHETKWLSIEKISGVPFDKGIIALPARGAYLKMRLPADCFGDVIALAGKEIVIEGNRLRLGIPVARPIEPAPALYSSIVTFKNSLTIEKFLETAVREFAEKEIAAKLEIPKETRSRTRRIITIKGKKVVGFSLIARDLSEEDSLRLQSTGIGGRRSMGCGIFNPIRKPHNLEGGINAI